MISGLLSSVYLGWSLGSNDAANIFGTAVTSRMLRFGTAAGLAAVFVLLGAVAQGQEGMRTVGALSSGGLESAGVASFAAAVTVTMMTALKLPVSASQAVVGGILGAGVLRGEVRTSGLGKVVLCWVGTPVGAFLAAIVVFAVLSRLLNVLRLGLVAHDVVLRACLVVAGCYGAYALGANNVANVTGTLVAADVLTPLSGVVIGAASIALGILTFGRRVMGTVGKGIVRLDAFSSLVVVVAEALTVHVYAVIGVPVSTSHAIVGAVLGVGVLKRIEALRLRAVRGVLLGWIATPLVAASAAVATDFVLHLRYVR